MSVTQYVGARYVPMFAEPIDWDITKAYSPLTIVYYQGNSYTSKQSVPTGTDINNDTYWALTGNYNAQIEQYRAEVVAATTGADTANATNTTQDAQLAGTTDSGLKTLIGANTTAISAETTRATAAEGVLDGSISAAKTEAQQLVSAESDRASAAEGRLDIEYKAADAAIESAYKDADAAITSSIPEAVNAAFPIGGDKISDGSIGAAKLDTTAFTAILDSIVVRHFDSRDATADNAGMQTAAGGYVAGFYIPQLRILTITTYTADYTADVSSYRFTLPNYIPKIASKQVCKFGCVIYKSGADFQTWGGLTLETDGTIGSDTQGFDIGAQSVASGTQSFLLYNAVGLNAENFNSFKSDNGVMQ